MRTRAKPATSDGPRSIEVEVLEPDWTRSEAHALVTIGDVVVELERHEVRRLQYEFDRLFPVPVTL